MRASIVYLIKEEITYDAIGQPISTETRRGVPCSVASITRNEWAAAGQLGVNPQIKIVMPFMNYDGEQVVELEGARYSVYRTYTAGDRMEVYLEKKIGA